MYSLHPLKQFVLELLRSFAKEFVSRAWDEFAPAAAFPGN